MPGRQGLRCHPHCQAAALLERPVILWPVGHLVTRPGDLVAARLIGLVGHRSSRRGGTDPILPALASSKSPALICAPRPLVAPLLVPSVEHVWLQGENLWPVSPIFTSMDQ